jgi:PelA/Pel-15E family pectate lyase
MLRLLIVSGMFSFTMARAQEATKSAIDTEPFQNSTHHWYDIADKGNVINPKPNQPRYKATELRAIADNILLYQKDNGGWPKNYDMQAVLTPEQKDSVMQSKKVLNTTFDNSTTYSQIACLAFINNQIKDARYSDAALKGLNFILAAQYQNGGWPQYFPLEDNYSRCITFNDDAYTGIMWLLKDIRDSKPQYAFVGSDLRGRLSKAFDRGLACILKTQINDNGKPTAWCQQYNEVTLEPAWARKFEPPSICNAESADVVALLMSLDHPSQQVIDAVQNAVAWVRESIIRETRVKTIEAPEEHFPYRTSHTDRIVVHDPSAPPIWTRYYELKTHRPLFCNRDSKVVYSLVEVQRERRDGYGWYTYEPQKILDRYGAWQKKWAVSEAAR